MSEPLWLTIPTATASLKERGNRAWLVTMAAHVANEFPADMNMVNIGVFKGASMHCLRAGAPLATLYGVDVNRRDVVGHEELDANFIWQDSAVCYPWVPWPTPVHLLFYDGGTRHQTVLDTIEGWVPKIPVGGFVIFTCYTLPPPRWAVREVVDEWFYLKPWKAWASPPDFRALRRED